MARLARNSWKNPMAALRITTARMTRPFLVPSRGSASRATTEATRSTQISGLLICLQRRTHIESP